MQGIECVIQVSRVTRRRRFVGVQLSPVGSQERSLLEPRNREVELRINVEVVAANRSIDEVLREREDGCPRESRVEITLTPIPDSPYARIVVRDDDPDGFSDLAHAYTLFAESETMKTALAMKSSAPWQDL